MMRVLKILISVSLIAFLVWKADLGTFFTDLGRIDRTMFALAVIILTVQYPVSAWKWRYSLRSHGIDYPFGYLLFVLCVGFFFNNFLPTAIGGDAYRAVRTMSHAPRKAYPISAVILERLLGLAALLLLGYACAIYLLLFGSLSHPSWVMLAVGAASAGIVLAATLWWFGLFDRFVGWLRGFSRLEPLCDSLRIIGVNREHLLGLVATSFLFQIFAIVAVALLFASLGLKSTFYESGFTAAAAGVAGILPISINGIGVVEGSFVAAAWEAGLPYADAIIVALFLRVFMLASSVVFGILYAVEPRSKREILKEPAT